MLTSNLMASMDDDHLIMALLAEHDPLTATPKEMELLKRFEAVLNKGDEDVANALDEYGFVLKTLRDLGDALIEDVPTTVELLKVLGEEDVRDADKLAADLRLVQKLRALQTTDHGEALDALTELLNSHD